MQARYWVAVHDNQYLISDLIGPLLELRFSSRLVCLPTMSNLLVNNGRDGFLISEAVRV